MIKRRIDTFLKQAALLYGCLFLFSCENDEKTLREWSEKKVMVDEVRDVTSLFSQQGTMKAKLTAPLMLRYNTDTTYTEFPKTLHVVFYDSTIHVESELFARYGKYFESLNKVLLQDSVIVFNIKGDTMRTSELWWDQNTRKFYTDKVVNLRTIDKQIYGGKGLEAEQDLSHTIIKYPTGTVQLADSLTH